MHLTVEYSQAKLSVWCVRIEDLDRYNEGACQQVRVHHAVEDVDFPVIGARGKQGVSWVERHAANCFGVISEHEQMSAEPSCAPSSLLECLVGSAGEIHVVPAHPPVVAADNEVVALRMDRQA